MTPTVKDNPAKSRYELEAEGVTAFATYQHNGDTLSITHTFTPPELRGKGIAAALVAGLLQDARQRGLRIAPMCSYVEAYFARHPEEKDLLAD
jgi:predicted GNAT family acetyltransferase